MTDKKITSTTKPADNFWEKLVFHPLFLPIALFIAFFLGLGNMPLVDLDEGAFGSATMEMLIRQDFITTYLGGDLRFDKPILIYWLQAISVSIFGLNEFGLRLPSAIMATAWACVIYFFCQHCFYSYFYQQNQTHQNSPNNLAITAKRTAQKGALIATIAMASSVYIVVVGRAAIADALLNCWLCLIMLSGYQFFSTGQKKYAYFGYAFMGLGLLTKGPIAVMIPVVVASLFSIIRIFSMRMTNTPMQNTSVSNASLSDTVIDTPNHPDYKARFLQLAFNPTGWLIALAIALPWYVLEYLDQGWLFIEGFILKHNLSRFSDAMEQHHGSVFYYVILLPFILLPTTAFLFNAFRKIISRSGLTAMLQSDFDCWMWLWFFFVLLFFSFSGTKLPHYVLYGCTPLFILAGKYHTLFLGRTLKTRALVFLPLLLWLGVLLALPTIFNHLAINEKSAYVKGMLQDAHLYVDWSYSFAIIMVMLFAVYVWLNKNILISTAMLHFAVAHTFVLVMFVLPFIMHAKQAGVKQAGLLMQQREKTTNETVVLDRMAHRSFAIYRGKVTPRRMPKAGELVLTDLDNLTKYQQTEVIYTQSGIVLMKVLVP